MNTRVDYLANHPKVVSVLAQWLFDEWGHHSPNRSIEGMTDNLRERMHQDRLPLALVALEAGEPIGSVSLKIREVEIRPQYEHWLGALYVAEPYRRRGLGSLLIEAAKNEAGRLGLNQLYLYTRRAETERLYKKLGWAEVERVEYKSRPALIMKILLDT